MGKFFPGRDFSWQIWSGPLKWRENCQSWLSESDPISCNSSLFTLLHCITARIKFPGSSRQDLGPCKVSLDLVLCIPLQTFSKVALSSCSCVVVAVEGLLARVSRAELTGAVLGRTWPGAVTAPGWTRGCQGTHTPQPTPSHTEKSTEKIITFFLFWNIWTFLCCWRGQRGTATAGPRQLGEDSLVRSCAGKQSWRYHQHRQDSTSLHTPFTIHILPHYVPTGGGPGSDSGWSDPVTFSSQIYTKYCGWRVAGGGRGGGSIVGRGFGFEGKFWEGVGAVSD